MTFTDDDLKRLKEDVSKHNGCCVMLEFSTDSMKALLARLEYGEFILGYFLREMPKNIICPCCNTEPHIPRCALQQHLESWRKVAGK